MLHQPEEDKKGSVGLLECQSPSPLTQGSNNLIYGARSLPLVALSLISSCPFLLLLACLVSSWSLSLSPFLFLASLFVAATQQLLTSGTAVPAGLERQLSLERQQLQQLMPLLLELRGLRV